MRLGGDATAAAESGIFAPADDDAVLGAVVRELRAGGERVVRATLLGFALLALIGCRALDTEAAARKRAEASLFIGKTRFFTSTASCTAAVFDVLVDDMRVTGGPVPVRTVRRALPLLKAGKTVAFVIPGQSPNAVSEALMSIDLPEGLGLLGSVLGPGKDCMTPDVAQSALAALMATDAVLIFDPERYTILLYHRSAARAYFLRAAS